MAATYDLAVIGCTGLVGEAILDVLAESRFPLGRLYVVDGAGIAGRRLEFKDRYLTVEALETFDFGKVRLALFATTDTLAGEHAPRAAASGCTVIDTSARFRQAVEVPLVVPEVNPEHLQRSVAGAIVASPSPAAVTLALALKPLHDEVGIERVDTMLCYPASAAGRAGVEELATQTARLLNARAIKPRVFRSQLAFNVLPQVGALSENGQSGEEDGLAAELRRILGPAVSVNATAIQVPVFYGLLTVVHVRTGAALSPAAARALLAQTAGLTVVDGSVGAGYPTPVTEAARHDAVFVGRIRRDDSHPRGLNFCVVADNVRKGAAINGIRLAELLTGGNS